jgi:bacillolysin
LETGETFIVQFYNGSSWQTVATYVADTDFVNGQFYNEQVTILESSYTFSSNMKIRFECIGIGNSDDIYIDEVVISGN